MARRKGQGRRNSARGNTAPVRMCVACRAEQSPDTLLRFVRAPSGTIHFDVAGRMPGRGVYTCATFACLDKALVRGGFRRGFDEPVLVDGTSNADSARLAASAVEHLDAEALRLLSLVFAARAATIGRERSLAAHGELASGFFIFAADLAENSKHGMLEKLGEAPNFVLATKDVLSHAVGSDKPVGIIHVKKAAGASTRLFAHLNRATSLKTDFFAQGAAAMPAHSNQGEPLRAPTKNIEAAHTGVGTPV